MPEKNVVDKVNIRPGVSILSVLRHLNYKPWFAIAEFVDNSLQSFLSNKEAIDAIHGKPVKLRVHIDLDTTDGGRLQIRDNAAGISVADFPRAFRPAEVPPDQTGLSEFGMGMKSAACWFASHWSVRTSALHDPVERTVSFDIEKIIQDKLEELTISSRPIGAKAHFTEVTLTNLHKQPLGKTVSKIKEHLASIYRIFIRNGTLELIYNGEKLVYPEVTILISPYHKKPDDGVLEWRKEIDFDFGKGLSARGFAGIRKTGSASEAGFALFRRCRLIQGSIDDTYRPTFIFGQSNGFVYQRLFGELELEGFEVSHTKDGFRWEEDEETFLELLKEHLDSHPLPLLDQSTGHRSRFTPTELGAGAHQATKRTAKTMERELPEIVQELEKTPDEQPPPKELPDIITYAQREIEISYDNQQWLITLELTGDPAVSDWLSLSDGQCSVSGNELRRLGIRLSLAHPFMEQFCGTSVTDIEPLLRMAVAVALSELLARDSGVKMASTFRRNINKILRDALSKP
ncbi:ATP-binding protein [Armatimonas sp.]|uniref:ATP-binding protein n=1 Tax=Armatimonas sp. TaxID=1872638 RepID=UPI00286C55B8|nr:ATP-binding protein [Armatimonas sp.]